MRTERTTIWDYEIGDTLCVKDRDWCQYSNLVGELIEITRFGDSGVLRFSEEELRRARDPERVLKAKREVHFYFRELDHVHITLVYNGK